MTDQERIKKAVLEADIWRVKPTKIRVRTVKWGYSILNYVECKGQTKVLGSVRSLCERLIESPWFAPETTEVAFVDSGDDNDGIARLIVIFSNWS